MSMHDALFGDRPIPEETYQTAHRAFPKGNMVMQIRDQFGMLYHNHQFTHLFASTGQPAVAPARLALITVLQFMEGVSDRQAADNVRDRISWKYALGLALDDPGFDFSVLSEFRTRLLTDNAEVLLFDTILTLFREVGLLKARGKQRTDSTHILAAIRELQRLENVGETMRHALNCLASSAPDWLRLHANSAWLERYGRRVEQYRLPKEETQRQALIVTIGRDGYHLLEACLDITAPEHVRTEPAVLLLQRVWMQQYYRSDDPHAPIVRWRTTDEQPPSAQIISSPYDPDARYKTKRDTSWIGYKAHLTETCDDETPNLITHVATTPATTADGNLTATIHADLAEKNLLPSEHYMDIGYVDAEVLVASPIDHGVAIIGPVITDPAWQAHTPNGITIAQFHLDWDAQQAICPEGNVNRSWHTAQDAHGNEMVVIKFHPHNCRVCPRQADCTKAQHGARTISLRTREHHEAIQQARARQQTPEFHAKYARRAGVEGTFTQGNRRSDLRHARYRGLAKVHLQHLITAIALNIVRAIAWLAEVPRATTRESAFAVLMSQTM